MPDGDEETIFADAVEAAGEEVADSADSAAAAADLRKILAEIDPKFTQKGPTPIYCDSEGCCKVSKNPVFRKRLKHLPMRLHYLRERARAGDVKLVWIKGDDNPADAFTKNLAKGPFEKHMATLSGSKRVRWAE